MRFEKMHCNGNDYIVIEDVDLDYSFLACKLCDHHFGVGADGLIIVKRNPLSYVCYNCFGEIDYSNNGIFCFVRYVYEHKISSGDVFSVLCKSGVLSVEITSKDPFMCRVNLGKPSFANQMMHVSDNISCFGRVINVLDYRVTIYSVNISGINTIVFVDSLESGIIDIRDKIANHKLFKRGCNVCFVCNKDRYLLIKCYDYKLKDVSSSVCLAASAMVCANKLGFTKAKCKVDTLNGSFTVEYKKDICFITGSATKVFNGILEEDVLC